MEVFKLTNKNKTYVFLFGLTLVICGVVTRLPIPFIVVSMPLVIVAIFMKGVEVSIEKSKVIIANKMKIPLTGLALQCYLPSKLKKELDDPTMLVGKESLVRAFRIDNYKDNSYFFVGQKFGNKEELLASLLKKLPPSRIEIKYYHTTSSILSETFVMDNNVKERYKA